MNATAEVQVARAAHAAPTITIEPLPNKRGWKRVLVNGVHWATVEMAQHGVWGSTYTFRQVGGRTIQRPIEGAVGKRERDVEVHSDKHAMEVAGLVRWRDKEACAAFPKLDQRLADEARKLIDEGLLRDPAVLDVERQAREHRWREIDAQEKAAARAADLEQAHALIAEHAPGLNDRDALANAIADQFARERGKP